jgi:hypothetical protein
MRRTARQQTTLTVGTQFQKNEGHFWTAADGSKHIHSFTTLCEVTDADAHGIRYVVREVLEEVGRPTEGAMIPTPGKSKGSLTHAGVAAAIGRYSIVPLAADHVVGNRRC